MKRPLALFWLILQVLLSQQIAFAHGLSHFADPATPHPGWTSGQPGDDEPRHPGHWPHACGQCLAAHAGGTAGPPPALPEYRIAPATTVTPVAGIAAIAPATRCHSFRSRAPPAAS